jgi:starch-binding outer membrane protein, SusD/RagB family
MKRKILIWFLGALVVVMAGCKKDFLVEKRDLTGFNEEVFKDAQMAEAYVGYIYRLIQPADNAISMVQWQTGANGTYSDAYTKTTEELAGQTDWNREWPTIAITQNHANQYFGQRLTSGIANNVWTRMKQMNLFITEIEKHGLAPEVTDPLKGQMLFWRAWQYFELLKLYGGVPLVLLPQNPIVADGDKSNEVPRSTSAETVAQIVKDLDDAIELLPGKWAAAAWGRITSGGAAALKGRVLLTWASPLFNRNDDKARWQQAYDACLAAKTLLEANGFGLHPSWDNMWFVQTDNPEGVIAFVFNNVQADQTQRNNGWEQATRSKQTLGSGSISPTKQMLDAFPMKDGKMPGDATGAYVYDPKKFYKNRDPRFAKTFVYNGALWPYAGATNFRQWTYMWYNNNSAATPNRSTETAGPNSSGIYVRKATSNSASNSVGNFGFSGTDYLELRFAEVILNLAEAAIGSDKLGEGLDYIKLIRQRAGLEAGDGNYGLGAAAGNRDMLFAAVLNERKIEFAYENKRFWDLRRWMLFNDDFGTCTRLGVQPLNGMRRTGLWITVKKGDGTKYWHNSEDPMVKKPDGTVPVIEREPAGLTPAQMEAHIDNLYDNYFNIIERDNLDPTSPANWKFKWYNEYYFFGLHQSILSGAPYLQQTKGWPDLTGAPGTFDPLQ